MQAELELYSRDDGIICMYLQKEPITVPATRRCILCSMSYPRGTRDKYVDFGVDALLKVYNMYNICTSHECEDNFTHILRTSAS